MISRFRPANTLNVALLLQITLLGVDGASGRLTRLGSIPTEKQPRGFAIDPAGKFLVVAGEKSDTISVYAIEADGAPAFMERYSTGKGSNWIEIVATE